MRALLENVLLGSGLYLAAYIINLARTSWQAGQAGDWNVKAFFEGIAKRVVWLVSGVILVGIIYGLQVLIQRSGIELTAEVQQAISALSILSAVTAGIIVELKRAIAAYVSEVGSDEVDVKITPSEEPGEELVGGSILIGAPIDEAPEPVLENINIALADNASEKGGEQ